MRETEPNALVRLDGGMIPKLYNRPRSRNFDASVDVTEADSERASSCVWVAHQGALRILAVIEIDSPMPDCENASKIFPISAFEHLFGKKRAG